MVKIIEIYWECDETGEPVRLTKTDSAKPNEIGYAFINKGLLDDYFRDSQGFLFGIVPDKFKQELKRFYKRRKENV